MIHKRWIGILSIVLCGGSWIAPAHLYASSDGFTPGDLELHSAGDLLDICTVGPGNEDYDVALAFCYGFFEGAIRYAQAIAGTNQHKKLVCAPAGTTRLEAVEVFVTYMKDNKQFLDEAPVDAIYRALIPRWPCK